MNVGSVVYIPKTNFKDMIKRDPWIWDAYKKGGGHSFPAGHLLRHQAAKMLPNAANSIYLFKLGLEDWGKW